MILFNKIRRVIKEREEDGYFDLEADRDILDFLRDNGELVTCYDEDYGGRWDKYEHKIFKFTENGKVMYIDARQTVGLTERQSDGGYDFIEVAPKIVTTTVYDAV